MRTRSAAAVVADGLAFPEGPVAADGAIWCVEVERGTVARTSEDGSVHRIRTGGRPNGLAPHPSDGSLWICDSGRDAVLRLDPVSRRVDRVATTVDGHALAHPNDLAFDAVGNLLFTCPGTSRHAPTGQVCCLGADGRVRVVAGGLYFPNGLAFSPDGVHLIVAETYRQRLWRGRWDPGRRRWWDLQVWARDLGGAPGPDGMAFTDDGRLLVAVYGSGLVAVIDEAGRMVDRLETPGPNPTNVAVEPGGRSVLVTEAELGQLLRLRICR